MLSNILHFSANYELFAVCLCVLSAYRCTMHATSLLEYSILTYFTWYLCRTLHSSGQFQSASCQCQYQPCEWVCGSWQCWGKQKMLKQTKLDSHANLIVIWPMLQPMSRTSFSSDQWLFKYWSRPSSICPGFLRQQFQIGIFWEFLVKMRLDTCIHSIGCNSQIGTSRSFP